MGVKAGGATKVLWRLPLSQILKTESIHGPDNGTIYSTTPSSSCFKERFISR